MHLTSLNLHSTTYITTHIQAKLNKKTSPHWYCSKKSDWFTLWLSIEYILGPALNCWADNFKLEFEDGTFRNTDGECKLDVDYNLMGRGVLGLPCRLWKEDGFDWLVFCICRGFQKRAERDESIATGVQTRVPGFGESRTLDYSDNHGLLSYYKPLVDALLKVDGAVEDVTVRSAPFDYRYSAPSDVNTKFQNRYSIGQIPGTE